MLNNFHWNPQAQTLDANTDFRQENMFEKNLHILLMQNETRFFFFVLWGFPL